MNTAQYNAGLVRGRRSQTEPGYLPPVGVYNLSEADRLSYMAGWEKGSGSSLRIDLLVK